MTTATRQRPAPMPVREIEEMIRRAYAITGYSPARNVFFRPSESPSLPSRACAIGVTLAAAESAPQDDAASDAFAWQKGFSALTGRPTTFAEGVVSGFDRIRPGLVRLFTYSRAYRCGYRLGRRIAKEVFRDNSAS